MWTVLDCICMKTFSTALWQDFMCSWLGWSFGARFWISFISRGSFVILCMGAERRDWRVCFASISSASRCLWKFSLIFLGERKWEEGRGEDIARDRKGRRRKVKEEYRRREYYMVIPMCASPTVLQFFQAMFLAGTVAFIAHKPVFSLQ